MDPCKGCGIRRGNLGDCTFLPTSYREKYVRSLKYNDERWLVKIAVDTKQINCKCIYDTNYIIENVSFLGAFNYKQHVKRNNRRT